MRRLWFVVIRSFTGLPVSIADSCFDRAREQRLSGIFILTAAGADFGRFVAGRGCGMSIGRASGPPVPGHSQRRATPDAGTERASGPQMLLWGGPAHVRGLYAATLRCYTPSN